MHTQADLVWLTLLGLSLLFVGGFVLWVYGTRKVQSVAFESEALRKDQSDLIYWFLMYGGAAVFGGIGCLLTALMIIL